jgi:hypothetical protein
MNQDKVNQDEINTMVASEIRKIGLNNVINIEEIKKKVMEKLNNKNLEAENEINEIETPTVSRVSNTFPNQDEDEMQSNVNPSNNQEPPTKIGIEPGSQSLHTTIQPKMAIIPEIPDFLKGVEPTKIFVYDLNELSVGGENLSNKLLKTLKDPEKRKSMQQMWSENGTTKATVYQTKFEKIGEIIFDYKSGTSQFIEKSAEPDFNIQQQYKENPYASEPKKEIETYIKNNVNLDEKINDVVTNIVKNYFLTNSERAQTTNNDYIEPNNVANTYPNIQENKITITKLINDFNKVDTPKELLETIRGTKKSAKLIYEDNEIKKWVLNGKEYYFQANPMSINKCYQK